MYSWSDKVVFITGAATGIGALVTRYLMREGVKHVAILDINEKAGVELQNELNDKNGKNKVKFYKCDVTDEEVFLGIFDAVLAEQGYIDVVINNAGIMNDGKHIYKKEIAINVTALVTGTLKAMEIMGKDQGGRGGTVINISSIAGLCQSPVFPIYFGTKAAVLQFSNCIGGDEYYSRTGVRVITLCFGATDTPLLYQQNVGNFNKEIESNFLKYLSAFPLQKIESAVQGVIDVYKLAASGSTWIATTDRPVKDITDTVNKAYGLLSEHVYK